MTVPRTLLGFLLLVGGLVATARPDTAGAQRVLRYVPGMEEAAAVLADLSFDVTWRDTEAGAWDAAVAYDVWFDGVPYYGLFVSASTFATEAQAAAFYDGRVAFMISGNELTRHYDSDPDEVVGYGHDFRLVYLNVRDEPVGNFSRLIRLGCAVALVEATKRLSPDDEPFIDNDRGLVMTFMARWVNRQMVLYPAACQ